MSLRVLNYSGETGDNAITYIACAFDDSDPMFEKMFKNPKAAKAFAIDGAVVSQEINDLLRSSKTEKELYNNLEKIEDTFLRDRTTWEWTFGPILGSSTMSYEANDRQMSKVANEIENGLLIGRYQVVGEQLAKKGFTAKAYQEIVPEVMRPHYEKRFGNGKDSMDFRRK